jgi:hypothetical protein
MCPDVSCSVSKTPKTYACPDDCGHHCKVVITWGCRVYNETFAFYCPMGREYMYEWKEVKAYMILEGPEAWEPICYGGYNPGLKDCSLCHLTKKCFDSTYGEAPKNLPGECSR